MELYIIKQYWNNRSYVEWYSDYLKGMKAFIKRNNENVKKIERNFSFHDKRPWQLIMFGSIKINPDEEELIKSYGEFHGGYSGDQTDEDKIIIKKIKDLIEKREEEEKVFLILYLDFYKLLNELEITENSKYINYFLKKPEMIFNQYMFSHNEENILDEKQKEQCINLIKDGFQDLLYKHRSLDLFNENMVMIEKKFEIKEKSEDAIPDALPKGQDLWFQIGNSKDELDPQIFLSIKKAIAIANKRKLKTVYLFSNNNGTRILENKWSVYNYDGKWVGDKILNLYGDIYD